MSDPTVSGRGSRRRAEPAEFRPIKLEMIDVESCPESIVAGDYGACGRSFASAAGRGG